MAFTADMYSGVPQTDQEPSRGLKPRVQFLLSQQPNTETSNLSETVPLNYRERILIDKVMVCMPDIAFRH